MASVSFTDSTGSATLEGYPGASVAARRFRNWTPFSTPIGEGSWGLGTGIRYQWQHRTDYGAAFEIPGILNTDVDLALRLRAHLIGGGSCTVTTLDASSRVYSTCTLAPDSTPELEFSDPQTLEYTLRLAVVNTEATPAPMLCEYP